MNYIKIFTTGGTIDKIYFDAKSKYEVGESNVPIILNELNVNFDYDVVPIFQKDSLDLTKDDRDEICKVVGMATTNEIIITHGTDTMVTTAKALAATSLLSSKTIVLTGALEPAIFKTSDAVFNIGGAVAAVQTLDAGVYIYMNGIVFNHDSVYKDVVAGRFVKNVRI